jgi:hypothetical protein
MFSRFPEETVKIILAFCETTNSFAVTLTCIEILKDAAISAKRIEIFSVSSGN